MKKVIGLLFILFTIINLKCYSQHLKFIVKKKREEKVNITTDTIVMYTNIENSTQNIKFNTNTQIIKTKQQVISSVDDFFGTTYKYNFDTTKYYFKTQEGKVIKNKEGKYVVMINKVGFSTLNLIEKNGSKEKIIERKTILVKPMPNILTSIAKKRAGKITVKEIIDSPIIKATCGIPEINKQITITSFYISIRANGEFKTKGFRDTNKLNSDAINYIKQLNNGSTMVIENIRCKLPDGTEISLPAMSFTINGNVDVNDYK